MSVRERRRWPVAVGIALAASQVALLAVLATGSLMPVGAPSDVAWFSVWFTYTLAGAVVLERIPGSPVGWLLCAVGSIPAASVVIELGLGATTATSGAYLVLPPLLLVALPAVFPDGVGSSARRRAALGAALLLAGCGIATAVLPPDAAGAASAVVVAGSGVAGLVLLTQHLRLARRAPQPRRTQHVMFLAGFAAVVVVMLIGQIVSALVGDAQSGTSWFQLLGLACLPVAIALATLGAGLWNTDLARGRRAAQIGVTVVPAALGALMLVALVVVLLPRPAVAALVAAGGTLLLTVAVRWAWGAARRWLYGPGRATEERIGTDAVDHAALVAAALRAPSAVVTTAPQDAPHGSLVLPLDSRRHLVVHPRRPGESFTRRDREVATSMGSTLAVQLERADLRASLDAAHAALASHRLDEQRRLRSALHDTVGPLLVGAEMQARALRDALGTPETEDVHDSLRQAREAMRSVLDEGSPRSLAAGLVPALTALAGRWPHPPVTVVADLDPEHGDQLGTRTSTAAYLIVAEALSNVTQHAEASSCQVRLGVDLDRLVISVTDDGDGIDPACPPGLGLASLRGRALELDGDLTVASAPSGTTITAFLPLREAPA